jgi:hypothetical protein
MVNRDRIELLVRRGIIGSFYEIFESLELGSLYQVYLHLFVTAKVPEIIYIGLNEMAFDDISRPKFRIYFTQQSHVVRVILLKQQRGLSEKFGERAASWSSFAARFAAVLAMAALFSIHRLHCLLSLKNASVHNRFLLHADKFPVDSEHRIKTI